MKKIMLIIISVILLLMGCSEKKNNIIDKQDDAQIRLGVYVLSNVFYTGRNTDFDFRNYIEFIDESNLVYFKEGVELNGTYLINVDKISIIGNEINIVKNFYDFEGIITDFQIRFYTYDYKILVYSYQQTETLQLGVYTRHIPTNKQKNFEYTMYDQIFEFWDNNDAALWYKHYDNPYSAIKYYIKGDLLIASIENNAVKLIFKIEKDKLTLRNVNSYWQGDITWEFYLTENFDLKCGDYWYITYNDGIYFDKDYHQSYSGNIGYRFFEDGRGLYIGKFQNNTSFTYYIKGNFLIIYEPNSISRTFYLRHDMFTGFANGFPNY